MRIVPSILLPLFLANCGPAPSESKRDSSDKIAQFKSTLEQRDARAAQWSKASPEDRDACELRAGDCRLQVSERREDFLRAQGVATCRNPDGDREARCVTDELLKRGDIEKAAEYYATDLWCLAQLLQCLTGRDEQAHRDAADASVVARRKSVEQSEQGLAQHARISLVAEKTKYLRATLPPDAEEECKDVREDDDSKAAATSKREELAQEYRKAEGEYNQARAVTLYDEATAKEAAGGAPEFDCLMSRLPKYGETPETRKWLDRNFEVLERRQKLIEKLGQAAGDNCEKESTAAHQQEIIRTYTAYVREPVLFFRMQLHRTFYAFHEAQVKCLKEWAKDLD